MATFWEIAVCSVNYLFSLYFVYLQYLFISRFGFKSGICLLIAPVHVHCFSITFKSGVWFLIAPVSVHCFSITLTHDNREACTEIQRRRYDEQSWEMCINSVWREKRRE